MAFCEFCGQPVQDGQLCNCPGAQAARGQAPAPAPAPATGQTTFCEYCGAQIPVGVPCNCPGAAAARQAQAYQQNGYQQQAGYGQAQPNGGNKVAETLNKVKAATIDKFKNGDKNTKIKLGAICGGIVAAIIAAFILIFCISWGYKGAVKDLQKGIQKADYEKICEAMIPDDTVDQMKEEKGADGFKDFMEEGSENLAEQLEDRYGDSVKCTIDIRKETEMKKKALENIEDFLVDQFGTEANVKKGYKLKVRISIKGSDDRYTDTGYLYAVKLGNGGGGWKIVCNYDDALRLNSLLDVY